MTHKFAVSWTRALSCVGEDEPSVRTFQEIRARSLVEGICTRARKRKLVIKNSWLQMKPFECIRRLLPLRFYSCPPPSPSTISFLRGVDDF